MPRHAPWREAFRYNGTMTVHYRQWRNWTGTDELGFVTTTALDFVHVFGDPRLRTLMAVLLVADCRRYGAKLHALVMPHHIHLLVRTPADRTLPQLMQRIKSNSAKLIAPQLPARVAVDFEDQRGLNGRSFWQKSFRSVTVYSEAVFWQKVEYIHRNPVRRAMVTEPEDYPWSSARDFGSGPWDEIQGLSLEPILQRLGVPERNLLISG